MAWDLKNEEEVKQYLENLGTEYRFGCLSEKKPEVCHLLGDFMESIKKDFNKAASLYRSTCDDYHFGRSCHKFATYSLTGKGCQADQPKALEYFKKGCSLGEADSCLYAGLLCTSNNEKHQVKLDYPQGMGFLNQSCDKGNHNGCYYLSGMYLSGVPNILEKNMTMAYNYSMKACELGNIYACANVSRMYSKGDGVAQNPELASKYKSKVLEMEKEMRGHFRPIEMERGA
ncbi:hypothetical protein OUZ56_030691 [Daphnia magna]|uniref:Cytochrome c oxidase assembly factor 7 n=1 Tax=Daphnia magna TaxID=35525 RepID=A0ABQ9ZS17_9CRUS|nr:hypothetical protein OUZ56_030691 [Daphnia magna]